MNAANEAPLSLRELSKRYGGRAVLDRVEMNVPIGSVLGLLGKNGAGKTTLIKCALGLVRPDGGVVHVLGEPATRLSARGQGADRLCAAGDQPVRMDDAAATVQLHGSVLSAVERDADQPPGARVGSPPRRSHRKNVGRNAPETCDHPRAGARAGPADSRRGRRPASIHRRGGSFSKPSSRSRRREIAPSSFPRTSPPTWSASPTAWRFCAREKSPTTASLMRSRIRSSGCI